MIICKKCNTENSDESKVCKKCKSKLKRPNYIFIIIVIILCLLAVYLIFAKTQDPDEIVIVPSTSPSNNEENNKEQNTNIDELPVANTDFNKSKSQIEKDVMTILETADEYFDYYNDYTSFVTRNGFLYDQISQKYVITEDLNNSEYENELFTKNEALMLYLKPQDVSSVIDKNINSPNILELFIVYETKDDYLFVSRNLDKTYVTKEQYKKLIDIYKLESSFSELVYPKNEEYEKIINTLKEFTNENDDFDVRFMSMDKRYSYAVVSPNKKFNEIKAFLLEKDNGKWIVKVDKIETYLKPFIEINNNAINFDLKKMPLYNLRNYKDMMLEDYTGIVKSLKADNHIDDSDGEVTFFSGTEGFVYLEFESNRKYLGRITEEGVLVVYPIQSYEEARVMMYSIKEDNPPFFILKQN